MAVRVWYHPGWQGNAWNTPLPEHFPEADDYAIDGAGQLQLYRGETIIATLTHGCWSVVQVEQDDNEALIRGMEKFLDGSGS